MIADFRAVYNGGDFYMGKLPVELQVNPDSFVADQSAGE